MSDILSKKVPFSLVAEQSVLGAVLIKPDCMDMLTGMITPNDFYIPEHQKIFSVMQGMYLKSHNIDVVTLIDELVTSGVYDDAGGKNYISLISDIVPTASNVKDYARIVKDKSILRALIDACETTAEQAYAEESDAKTLIELAEDRIYSISAGNSNNDFVHIKEGLMMSFKRLNDLQENRAETIGMQTGFSGIDRTLVGMGKGDLIIVGARPGVGKSSLAMNIVVNTALRTDKSVCVFSLEMTVEQLSTRLLSSEALVNSNALRSGNIKTDSEEWTRLCQAASRLSGCNIYINDTSGITVSGMKAQLRRVKNLGLVVVDYLGLVQSEYKTDNKAQEIEKITNNLKRMAKEFGVPFIVCAQLNRDPDKRSGGRDGSPGGKRPALSDLRDSGAIEQDADVVMFIYRPGEYDKDDPEKQTQAEIIIAKNRHGSQGIVKMNWLGQYTKFITVENEEGLTE